MELQRETKAARREAEEARREAEMACREVEGLREALVQSEEHLEEARMRAKVAALAFGDSNGAGLAVVAQELLSLETLSGQAA